MKITFPDGSSRDYDSGTTLTQIAQSIGPRLARESLAAMVNGALVDMNTPLNDDSEVRFVTFKDEEGVDVFRHSSSHVMAQAVKRLYPEAALAIGPPIEDGFYYDIDVSESINEDDLKRIEEEMAKIVSEKIPFTREVLPRNKAIELFKQLGESYKVEMINELDDDNVSVYRQGDFVDMCLGPHVPDTGYVKVYKLLHTAGAYWRGDEHNKMLQRLYGTSWLGCRNRVYYGH